MKHKTIRQNVFETNSSSTHSVTLAISSHPKPNFKPYSQDGKITVGVGGGYWESETWSGKLSLLGDYLIINKRPEELGRVEKLISDFCGQEVTFDENSVKNMVTKYANYSDCPINDLLEDHFYIFLKDQYETKELTELTSVVDEILESDEMIVGFVCGSGWMETHEYYDG